MRTIAMIYHELGSIGGIQRGAETQIDQFREWGYEPIVLTESDLGSGSDREARLCEILKSKGAELVIEHDAYTEKKLSADISASRSLGLKIIVFWHCVFSWMIVEGGRNTGKIFSLLQKTDAIITLSPTDQNFFRLLGCRSLCIPYCDADIMNGGRHSDSAHNLVWVGRFVNWKRPLDAVKILEKTREKVPDAELYLLGDGIVRPEIEKYIDSHPQVRGSVHLEGFVRDVRPYLENSGVGLVTSKFEGCCHSMIEMKMASMPIVAYDMPYFFEFGKNCGIFGIPQGDVSAAANAVVRLLKDDDLRKRQGELARKSYDRMCALNQRGSYELLFCDVAKDKSESRLLDVDADLTRCAINTLVEHSALGMEYVAQQTEARVSRRYNGGYAVQGFRGMLHAVFMGVWRRIRCLRSKS